jgi:hypothetical protein
VQPGFSARRTETIPALSACWRSAAQAASAYSASDVAVSTETSAVSGTIPVGAAPTRWQPNSRASRNA